MKHNKVIIILMGVMAFTFVSCKKTLKKINTNPNATEKASPGLLFSTAAVNLSVLRSDGDLYIPLTLAGQTISSGGDGGWGKGDVYDIDVYALGDSWKTFYSSAGFNLKEAIRIAESASPASSGAAAQCKVLLAEDMFNATMIWGDIPFSEAWMASSIAYPKFDSQKDLLNSLLALLDEAVLQMDDENADKTAIISQDYYYGGDLSKWRSAAKSIKFRILMIMVDKDPSKAADIQKMISDGGMIASAEESMVFNFGTKAGNQNPKYALLHSYGGENDANIFFFANTNVLDPMKTQNDPRIPFYFDKPEGVPDYVGVQTEETGDIEYNAVISKNLYKPEYPDVLFSYQEQLFLEAEAYARGLAQGGMATADEKYKAALGAACDFYNVSPTAVASFIASKSLLNISKPIDEIHLQQWIDLMDRPLEAFTNWRRSGADGFEIPQLSLPLGSPDGPLMRRWVYPTTEEILPNVNAPKGVVNIYDKLWFDL